MTRSYAVHAVGERGRLVGHVFKLGCTNPTCRRETAAGKPWHALPAGFAMQLPTYHYATKAAAEQAVRGAASLPVNRIWTVYWTQGREDVNAIMRGASAAQVRRWCRDTLHVKPQSVELADLQYIEPAWIATMDREGHFIYDQGT